MLPPLNNVSNKVYALKNGKVQKACLLDTDYGTCEVVFSKQQNASDSWTEYYYADSEQYGVSLTVSGYMSVADRFVKIMTKREARVRNEDKPYIIVFDLDAFIESESNNNSEEPVNV